MKKVITRTILLLSLVSLFNDIASEMLIPILPLFLTSIGFSTFLIGLLEGTSEAMSGISKMYFGTMSDQWQRRMPFVRLGYLLSALVKPVPGIIHCPPWIFFSRISDKLGKGVRTAARDALLSDEAPREQKAAVFGFHRGMDTLGAVIGPIAALLYLQTHPADYAMLFILTIIPGLLAVSFTFLIRDKKKAAAPQAAIPLRQKFFYWNHAPSAFKKLMVGLLFFGLMNSSDAFLLLQTKHLTGSDSTVLWCYIFYNLVYALLAFPLGRLADRLGMKRILIAGLLIFALVYGGMACAGSLPFLLLLLAGYGAFAAATDGVSKALVSNMVPRSETASAIGCFTGWNSMAALLASPLAGWLWYAWSPAAMFAISATGTLVAATLLLFMVPANVTATTSR